MKERIQELALLSGFDIDTNVSFAEKTRLDCFAKLIVRECVGVIETKMPEFSCKEEYDNLYRKAGRLDAIDEIKQHFGVE